MGSRSGKSSSKKESKTRRGFRRELNAKCEKFWQGVFVPTGLTFMAIYVASFVVQMVFAIIPGNQSENTAAMMIEQALVYALSLVIILYLPEWIKKVQGKGSKQGGVVDDSVKLTITREEMGVKGGPTWTDIGLAPVGLIVYYLLAAMAMSLFMVFPWFQVNEEQDVGFSTYLFGVDRIMAFIALCVVAPIMEELIFRGFLYGKIRNSYGVVVATVVVSLLFGFLHGQWNVGVNVAVMSAVMCGMREVTGTIYSGILLHMGKNFVAFMLLYVLQIQ